MCRTSHRSRRGVAALSGELDLTGTPRLSACLTDVLASAWLVVVDLRELTFMDSSGVAAIIAADKRARRSERRLVLIRGPAQVTRLINLVDPARRLEITDLSPTHAATQAAVMPTAAEASLTKDVLRVPHAEISPSAALTADDTDPGPRALDES
jgi:anti-anti-sigma factor